MLKIQEKKDTPEGKQQDLHEKTEKREKRSKGV